MTEDAGGGPHAGSAEVMTWSVQLYEGGAKARVLFGVRFDAQSLTCGASIMFA